MKQNHKKTRWLRLLSLVVALLALAVPQTHAWNFDSNTDPQKIVLHFNNNIGGDNEMSFSTETWTYEFVSTGEALNFTVRCYYSVTNYHEYYDDQQCSLGSWTNLNMSQNSGKSYWINGLTTGAKYKISLKGQDSNVNNYKVKFEKIADPVCFTPGSTFYFDLNGNTNWPKDSAKFAANFNNGTTSSGSRVWFTQVSGEIYSCEVPSGCFTNLEILRMDPNNTLSADAWNYTNNISAESGKNLAKLASSGWTGIDFTLDTYTPPVQKSYVYYLNVDGFEEAPNFVVNGNSATLTKMLSANDPIRFRVQEIDTTNETWYCATANATVSDTEVNKSYSLSVGSKSGNVLTAPNDGTYSFELVLGADKMPTQVKITAPESYTYSYALKVDNNYEDITGSGANYSISKSNLAANQLVKFAVKKVGSRGTTTYTDYGVETETTIADGGATYSSLTSTNPAALKTGRAGEYTFALTVNASEHTISSVVVTAPTAPVNNNHYYIKGDINGDWSTDQEIPCVDGVYYLDFSTTASNKELLIKKNNDTTLYGPDPSATTVVSMGTTYTLKYGTENEKNFRISEVGDYRLTLTLDADENPASIVITRRSTTYDYYLNGNFDGTWKVDPYKTAVNGNRATITVNNCKASSSFMVKVYPSGTRTNDKNYKNKNSATVANNGGRYELGTSGSDFTLPAIAGNYTFELELGDDGLPTHINISRTSGGSVGGGDYDYYMGSSNNWSGTKMPAPVNNVITYTSNITQKGKIDFGIKVTEQGSQTKKFWYWRKGSDKGAIVGGTYELDEEGNGNGENFHVNAVVGVYTFKITLDPTTKLPTYIEIIPPETDHPTVYLGSGVHGDFANPSKAISWDNATNAYEPFSLAVNGSSIIRFSTVYQSSTHGDWMGPNNDTDIQGISNPGNTSDVLGVETSEKVYTIKGTGQYTIQVLSYDRDAKTLTFTVTKEYPDYYFVGDLNDWFSEEFANPEYDDSGNLTNQGLDTDKFFKEKNAWKFRKVTAADVVPHESITTDWYVFDKLPKNRLTGQFQIIAQSSWNGEVYSHVNRVGISDGKYKQNEYNAYHSNPLVANSFLSSKMQKDNGQNFHIECNAIEGAKIYFKPGDTGSCNMYIEGTERNYYIFYVAKASEIGQLGTGSKVTAKINAGKPNENNYMLPGIGGLVHQEKIGGTWTTMNHMNTTGIDLVKLNDVAGQFDATTLTARGIDTYNQADILNNNHLPGNNRALDDMFVYAAKIPNGFASPAGWKYNMNLTSAIRQGGTIDGNKVADDRERTAALTTGHIYYIPDVLGVAVFLDDSELEESVDEYGNQNWMYKDYDVEYWYRVYNSKAQDGNYSIVLVGHGSETPALGYTERVAFSEKDARPETHAEPEAVKFYGWHKLQARDYEAPDVTGTWRAAGGGGTDIQDASGNKRGLLLVPEQHANAYVQFARVLKPKSSSPSSKPRKEAGSGTLADDMDFETAYNSAANVDFLPSKLSFDVSEYHNPFNGTDLFKTLPANSNGVWTDVKEIEIEDEPIRDAEEVAIDAEPVFYNLQGQRVKNPGHGMYIMIKGNKSKKILL